MGPDEKRSLIERYINAYNTFDIEGMLTLVHPDVAFKNVVSGQVNATAVGKDELSRLAEESRGLFDSRYQTILRFESADDQANVDVEFVGVLATDLPNGLKKGQTFKLAGRSEFTFKDGTIFRITDITD